MRANIRFTIISSHLRAQAKYVRSKWHEKLTGRQVIGYVNVVNRSSLQSNNNGIEVGMGDHAVENYPSKFFSPG